MVNCLVITAKDHQLFDLLFSLLFQKKPTEIDCKQENNHAWYRFSFSFQKMLYVKVKLLWHVITKLIPVLNQWKKSCHFQFRLRTAGALWWVETFAAPMLSVSPLIVRLQAVSRWRGSCCTDPLAAGKRWLPETLAKGWQARVLKW